MIRPLPRLADLLGKRRRALGQRGPEDAWREFSPTDYQDLQALFELSWFGFKAREDFPEIRALCAKKDRFTRQDIEAIHQIEREILRRVLPLYRRGAERGQIEIAASAYAHPILPLLIDSDAAREGLPRAALPARFLAPEDARRQIEEALDFIEAELGGRPRGLWPSEGSVSEGTVDRMAACGVQWTASDVEVLAASERDGPADPYRVWRITGPGSGTVLVFRDHDLSDRIGFTYARLAPAAAVEDFLAALRQRAAENPAAGRMVLVALDGENPWEYYPAAGAQFLRALYGALRSSQTLVSRPVHESISSCPQSGTIHRLRAGSWIGANFGIWIGGPEKNRAWALLGRVRSELHGALGDTGLTEKARRDAWTSLRAAEGSDWFWWLDGQFVNRFRSDFDRLFRGHLRRAYEALERRPPDVLDLPIASSAAPDRPVILIEPGIIIAPRIDGFEGSYFEWYGAVELAWEDLSSDSVMQRAHGPFESVRCGVSAGGEFCLRLDPSRRSAAQIFCGLGVDLFFRSGEETKLVSVDLDEKGDLREARPGGAARAAARKILEMTVTKGAAGLAPGLPASLLVRLRTGEGTLILRETELRLPVAGPPRRAA